MSGGAPGVARRAARFLREKPWAVPALILLAGAVHATAPLFLDGYYLSLGISLLSFTVLATAWSLFSGATRYISLATVAFFGIGAYTVAVAYESLPWLVMMLAVVGVAAVISLLVGLSTLRLRGVYFVIFTFGLAELIRQVVTWYEVNVNRSVGRYIFMGTTREQIYWQLLVLLVVVLITSYFVQRSRLGLALRMIGDDEAVARHTGVRAVRVKLVTFVLSSVFMALTGAIMAPRWIYIDPAIAFAPTLSFQVVIMALLGGVGSVFGPLLGAVPLVLLFEWTTANFPNSFSIVLGLIFIGIVYFLPGGVLGLVARFAKRRAVPAATEPLAAVPEPLASAQEGAAEPTTGGVLLEVAGLSKSFGGLMAIKRLDLQVHQGEILGLIGPNGSGKTTALNIISGAFPASGGSVKLAGADITGRAPESIAAAGVARTYQLVRVFASLSAKENVIPGFAFRPKPLFGREAEARALELLTRVGLAGKADVEAAQLTYIDQKRLELARALAQDPKLLLLDEWLAGLNPSEMRSGVALIRSLRAQGVTMILVEHVMDAVRALCDRCVVMSVGEVIAAGDTSAVLSDPKVITAYLGDDDD